MVGFRRNFVPGGTFFFTVNLRDRKSSLLVDYIDVLRDKVALVKMRYPFHIDAIVVLPDHLHTIWTLPEGDADYPGRWRAIKSQFTQALKQQGVALQRNKRGDHHLWQRRYWEHTVRDENDMQRHVDYIHYNPVKHGWVKHVSDWPYSSFHRYVERGWLNSDWGSEYARERNMEFGE